MTAYTTKRLRPLAALIAALPLLPLHAADTETELPKVEVQATAIAADPKAGNTSSTERAELEARFIKDYGDLGARGEPGVDFERSGRSLNIRGLNESRIEITVDDILLPDYYASNRTNKSGNDTVDFASLSRIDVVRNGGQYSPLGSSVALYTLRPEDLLKDGHNLGALVRADYDSADASTGLNAALAGRAGAATRWLVQAGARQGEEVDNQGTVAGIGSTRTEANPQDVKRQQALFKVDHQLGGGQQIGLSAEHQRTDTETNDLVSTTTSTPSVHNDETQQRQRASLRYDFKNDDVRNGLNSAYVLAYWQRLDQGYHNRKISSAGALTTRDETYSQDQYGLKGQLGAALGENQQLTAGADWRSGSIAQYTADSRSASTYLQVNQRDMPLADSQDWGVFVSDELSLNQALSLTGTLRYQSFERTPEADAAYLINKGAITVAPTASKGDEWLPKLRLDWQAAPSVAVFAQYAYGMRAPDAQELYLTYGSPSTYLQSGNPDLKAETSRGIEVGAELGTAERGGKVAVYYNRYRDFIDTETQSSGDSTYPMGIYRYVNLDRVRIYGAEASAHWQLAQAWRTTAGLAWAVGKDENSGQYLNSVAPLKATASLAYTAERWGSEVLLSAAQRQSKVETSSDFQAPGYATVDLTAHWQPAAIKDLRLQAGVMNLFDKTYWKYSYVPTSAYASVADRWTQPGRSFRVSANWQY